MTDYVNLMSMGFAAAGLSHCWWIKRHWWMLCYSLMFWLVFARILLMTIADTYGYENLYDEARHLVTLLIALSGGLGTCFLFKRIRSEP